MSKKKLKKSSNNLLLTMIVITGSLAFVFGYILYLLIK